MLSGQLIVLPTPPKLDPPSEEEIAKVLYESERRTILDGVLSGVKIDPHIVERHLPEWENLSEQARVQKMLYVQSSFLSPLDEADFEITRKGH